jgi:competence protein ComEA
MIEAYITGAVQHPGVYKLESGARVYELLRMAGGPLPSANLVTLNLAARLTDGEEVYVLAIGETPPVSVTPPSATGTSGTATGSLVNINTASVTDMRQLLHVSSTTAQKIIDYRQQHGSYTSVDQLLQVVSKSVYDKIKSLVTV